MNSMSTIALSGMQAAQTQLRASAHNVANLPTEGFRRQQVQQTARPAGGVDAVVVRAPQAGADLARDVVQQLQARHAFLASHAVFKAADAAAGALLDTRA